MTVFLQVNMEAASRLHKIFGKYAHDRRTASTKFLPIEATAVHDFLRAEMDTELRAELGEIVDWIIEHKAQVHMEVRDGPPRLVDQAHQPLIPP